MAGLVANQSYSAVTGNISVANSGFRGFAVYSVWVRVDDWPLSSLRKSFIARCFRRYQQCCGSFLCQRPRYQETSVIFRKWSICCHEVDTAMITHKNIRCLYSFRAGIDRMTHAIDVRHWTKLRHPEQAEQRSCAVNARAAFNSSLGAYRKTRDDVSALCCDNPRKLRLLRASATRHSAFVKVSWRKNTSSTDCVSERVTFSISGRGVRFE